MLDYLARAFQANPYAWPILFIAALVPLIGGYIYFQNRNSSANRYFFFLCLAIFFWMIGQAGVFCAKFESQALSIYRSVAFLGVVWIGTLVYAFSVVWLGIRSRWMLKLGVLGSIVFYAVGLFSSASFPGVRTYYWGYYPIYGPANWVFLGFFFSYFFVAFYNFASSLGREKNRKRLAQIQIITTGFIISFFSSLDYLPKLTVAPIFPLGFLFVFTWIMFVAYAIIRYHAMDIETVIHKTLLWLGTLIVAMMPFIALIFITHNYMVALTPFQASAIFSVFIVFFYFYFQSIKPFLDKLFQKRRSDLRGEQEAFTKELVFLTDLRSLLQRFSRLVRRSLYVQELSIFLLDETQNAYLPVMAKRIRGLKALEKNHPFLVWIEKEGRIQQLSKIHKQGDSEFQTAEINLFFENLHAFVITPFIVGEKMIGFAGLGKRANLSAYSYDEIQYLASLAFPVSIAISNSRQLESISSLYDQVQKQNERLKELDRLKSEFLANTSHELRTPLNGILGLVESILDGADGDLTKDQKKHLGMIMESGTGLKELINNLLELSRLEAGQAQFNQKPFNMSNVIHAVISLTEALAVKKGIYLKKMIPQNVPDVFGDPDKIQRVLINLVGNAIKFTSKGGVTIQVSEVGGKVRTVVEDSGVGIPKEYHELIFDRFRQVDGSSTRQFEGTGLGLAIAREIMLLHGSDIVVESEVQKGSRFYFDLAKSASAKTAENVPVEKIRESLKIQPLTKEKEAVFELEKDKEYEEAIRGAGEKILIIDDNPVNREVVKTRLQMNNYQVREAVDGLQGLERVSNEEPDLIILDLMMPRMSGYEFCETIRKKYSLQEIPIIMLTAKTEMGDKIYGLNMGANDYIAKPFNKEELIARVSMLLKIKKMTQELKKWNAELELRVDQRTKELAKTQEQLVQAEKLATIGTLAGGVAHEINNPLTAVLTNAQILKMDARPEDSESLNLIEEGAKRCQVIVQKLLKYARTSHEKNNENVDLHSVIQNVCSFLAYQLKQESIRVTLDLKAVDKLEGNSNELEQVFTNLILNAKDAIRKKKESGEIVIATEQIDDRIQVKVSDDGCGIKKEHIGKIFDPFFTTKDVGAGTGLGLAVTYGILEKHRCKVQVVSEEGEGAQFILSFPVTQNIAKH